MNILTWLLAFLTFPGVMVHEWAHTLACRLSNISVYKVVYFRFGNPLGYVQHEGPRTLSAATVITIGPLVVNSILAILLMYIAIYPTVILWGRFVLGWLSFSVGMHAIPSSADVKNIQDLARSKNIFIWLIAWIPIVPLKLLSILKVFHFDIVYAVLLMYVGFLL